MASKAKRGARAVPVPVPQPPDPEKVSALYDAATSALMQFYLSVFVTRPFQEHASFDAWVVARTSMLFLRDMVIPEPTEDGDTDRRRELVLACGKVMFGEDLLRALALTRFTMRDVRSRRFVINRVHDPARELKVRLADVPAYVESMSGLGLHFVRGERNITDVEIVNELLGVAAPVPRRPRREQVICARILLRWRNGAARKADVERLYDRIRKAERAYEKRLLGSGDTTEP